MGWQPPARESGKGLDPRLRWAVLAALGAGFLYFLIREGTVGREALVFFAVLIPSVILHEVSHGVAALAFGDTTARDAGRLTLNPVRHVDPFGTVILPALLVLSGAAAFGYAKPVPTRPSRMRNPRTHSLLTSLVGPATNIALLLLAAGVWSLLPLPSLLDGANLTLLGEVVLLFGLANVVLAVFNLIPIPPLDGSAVLERFLPERYLEPYLRLRPYSMLLLLGLFLFVPGLFDRVLSPAIDLWFRLLV